MARLSLHEEVLLLALHDEKGTVPFGTSCGYALGGAILAELTLARRIAIEQVKRSKLVASIGSTPTGDPVVDECLERIRTAKRRASAATWVGRFANRPLWKRIAERLYMRGILRKEQGRFLLVFSRDTFPTANPEPERELVERMRAAIFGDGQVDARTAIVVGLASAGGLLPYVYDRKQLRERKRRITELAAMDSATGATKAAIEAAQAAMAAVTAATVAATAASS